MTAGLGNETTTMGKTVTIQGQVFTVVGVLSDADSSDVLAQAQNQDTDGGRVIVPYSVLMTLTGVRNISSLSVYVTDTVYTQQVQDSLETALKSAFNYKDNSYRIINMAAINQQETPPVVPVYDVTVEWPEAGKTAKLVENGEVLKTETVDGKTRIYLSKIAVFSIFEII